MYPILKREFIDSFKSIRSMLIILFITVASYQSASYFNSNPSVINEMLFEGVDNNAAYAAVISLILMVLGFLFAFAISHDLINKEIELKTIRLLITKISCLKLMLGKLLGTLLFWIVTVSISYSIIYFISDSWHTESFLQAIVFIFYVVSLVFLISTIVTKSKLTMFLGIILGLILPILGLLSITIDKWYLLPFKYLLPYKYLNDTLGYLFIPLSISLVYILIAVTVMRRRDF